jgi:hypothetical protein
MFTRLDSHLFAPRTGLAHASTVARGWIQADNAALARRIAPC